MAPKLLLRNVTNVVSMINVEMLGLMPCLAGIMTLRLIVVICQTRPVIVQKPVIPGLKVFGHHENGFANAV